MEFRWGFPWDFTTFETVILWVEEMLHYLGRLKLLKYWEKFVLSTGADLFYPLGGDTMMFKGI